MKTIGRITYTLLAVAALAFASCNKDGEITTPAGKSPIITLDSPTSTYTAKAGRTFRVSPAVENGAGAVFSWKYGGQTISTARLLEYSFPAQGRYFITLKVTNDHGYDEAELRVDVSDMAPPVISLAVPAGGVRVKAGQNYLLSPDVQNGDGATYLWTLDGREVGTAKEYTFSEDEPGAYSLALTATNEDGQDTKGVTVTVLEFLPLEIATPASSLRYGDPLVKTVFSDKKIFLRPMIVNNAIDPTCTWSVNEVEQVGQTEPVFVFEPGIEGEYEVTFTVTDSEVGTASVTYTVTCVGTEESGSRAAAGEKDFNKVWEYLPAPGQFINEPMAGFTADVTTMDAACAYAEERLNAGSYVSLGAWGGYLVAGFDHSVENRGGEGDFSIGGNSFAEGSEPGVVWVMQDVNGNGEPDDEWYELKGSEYGQAGTIQDYSVTYYKPAGKGVDVQWTDNRGASGRVDYLKEHHGQDHYYPGWVGADTYTLYGTRLKDNAGIVDSYWSVSAFDWGYADNDDGSDTVESAGEGMVARTHFRIDNAIYPDGSPAELKYIDFVKVQTGVNSKAGPLGEVSTEVMSIEDTGL